ncbi:MAG: DUF58 domain-containing protein [Clostridia bacterium]|nr:DUF58 domain-containing protein [Clostridia bacterium]
MDIVFFLITTVVPWLVKIFFAALAVFVTVLLARLIRRFSVDRLRYERYFADTCVYEGDSTELVETIWNPTWFPVPFADVGCYFYSGLAVDGKQPEKGMSLFLSRYHLLPFEKVTRRLRVECVKRGCYQLTSVFISRPGEERHIDAPAEIFVYPRIENLADGHPGAYGMGDVLSRRKLIMDPFTVSGVREYQPGDSFHTINFKASARLSVGGQPRFTVNRYEYCSNFKYYIYQNFHIPKGGDVLFSDYEDMMEDGLRFAASLVVRSLGAGGICAFGANCTTLEGGQKLGFPLRGGEVHKNDILREMAKIRAIDGASFASILAEDIANGVTNSEVFIITAYVDESIGEQISLLEYMGNTVRVIELHPAQCNVVN